MRYEMRIGINTVKASAKSQLTPEATIPTRMMFDSGGEVPRLRDQTAYAQAGHPMAVPRTQATTTIRNDAPSHPCG